MKNTPLVESLYLELHCDESSVDNVLSQLPRTEETKLKINEIECFLITEEVKFERVRNGIKVKAILKGIYNV